MLKWTNHGLMDSENLGLRIEPLINQCIEVNGAIKWIFERNRLSQIGLVEDFPDSTKADAGFTFYFQRALSG